ncbi:cell division protein FtsQ [Pseudomonas syringae]|uniref:alginate O-acetyltransferase AlgX-related protein n=1 Tax=Pseudomonas syringae TaxID=317 RepID=UPI001F482378|nr:cell division protein FtsQ [Pseudomonas syringae]MCF8983795.1 cell division protein FtsQ [Pseudomonas syringae]MCF9003476.1 cell division protein FtsQ [Pseudomonas syringae]
MTTPSAVPPPPSELAVRTCGVAGITLALLLGVGLLASGMLLVSGKVELLPKPLTLDAALHGEVTHQLAKQLSGTFLARHAADIERGASWLLFHDTGPRVRQGCPGWLFLTDEFRLNRDAQANAQRKAQAVIAVQRSLKKRGIELLVAVVPDKSRIAATRLCGLYRPDVLQTRVQHWTHDLQAAGVNALDLTAPLQPLGEAAYLRTDTHWSESGANSAARAIGLQVQKAGIQATPQCQFQIQTLPIAERPGDLVRLAGLDWLPSSLQPAPQSVAATQITELASESAAGSDNLDDLFGDSNLPNVALIGTSFSRNSGFVGFLQRELGAPIGNFARDGGEFSGAANVYFDNPAFRQTPPKLLIWEIPERDLQTPYVVIEPVERSAAATPGTTAVK